MYVFGNIKKKCNLYFSLKKTYEKIIIDSNYNHQFVC